jgi:Competence-damaged protein
MAARFPPEPLKAIVEEVASLLKARKETISVAETAAGGLISAALLATHGASGFYKGGLTVCFRPWFFLFGFFVWRATLCGALPSFAFIYIEI